MQTGFKTWRKYFLYNKEHFNHIHFSQSELSEAETEFITSSIQQFQKGESSEGLYLLKVAKETGDEDYLESIRLFIAEEKNHATSLARFMRQENIPLLKSHWVDSCFRGLRRVATFENTITVVLTAEIIAAVYYRALKNVTRSQPLSAICKQIISDEEMHINFQCQTLHDLRLKNSGFKKFIYGLYRRVLMTGTTLITWFYHGSVLRKGGFSFTGYLAAVETEFFRSQNMIEGRKEIAVRSILTKETV